MRGKDVLPTPPSGENDEKWRIAGMTYELVHFSATKSAGVLFNFLAAHL